VKALAKDGDLDAEVADGSYVEPSSYRLSSTAHEPERSPREKHAIAERAAYQSFRKLLTERHEAVRERQSR
jgi:hypothetical protein